MGKELYHRCIFFKDKHSNWNYVFKRKEMRVDDSVTSVSKNNSLVEVLLIMGFVSTMNYWILFMMDWDSLVLVF